MSACGADNSVCTKKEILKTLKYDFGYELLQSKNLPQIEFNDFVLKKESDNLFWCSTEGRLSGSKQDVLESLKFRLGLKHWKRSNKNIELLDLSKLPKLDSTTFKNIKSDIAIFMINKYLASSTRSEYVIPVKANYMISKKKSRTHSIEWLFDVNITALKIMSRDFKNVSASDQLVIDRILKK